MELHPSVSSDYPLIHSSTGAASSYDSSYTCSSALLSHRNAVVVFQSDSFKMFWEKSWVEEMLHTDFILLGLEITNTTKKGIAKYWEY